MALALADLLREHWPGYARANRAHLAAAHHRAVRSVLSCRTPALGGRRYRCGGCGESHFAYHSCNHRSCPQCGAAGQQAWAARQEARLLPVPYFMVTFTLPAELRRACLAHPAVLYDLLLRESAGALADVVATRNGGARSGCTSVLHTWGRQVQHHPHVHCVVPAVALDAAGGRPVHPPKDGFLVHYRPLADRFRGRVQGALRDGHPELYAALGPAARRALSPATRWNVQLQPVGRGATALRYLARYVCRSAFSPGRLLGYDREGNVLLRWTSSDTGRTGVLHLHPHEFIRRWLLHVLPKGFPRTRHYGFLAGAAIKALALLRLLLGAGPEPAPRPPAEQPFLCPRCGGVLEFLRAVARANPKRGPPPPGRTTWPGH